MCCEDYDQAAQRPGMLRRGCYLFRWYRVRSRTLLARELALMAEKRAMKGQRRSGPLSEQLVEYLALYETLCTTTDAQGRRVPNTARDARAVLEDYVQERGGLRRFEFGTRQLLLDMYPYHEDDEHHLYPYLKTGVVELELSAALVLAVRTYLEKLEQRGGQLRDVLLLRYRLDELDAPVDALRTYRACAAQFGGSPSHTRVAQEARPRASFNRGHWTLGMWPWVQQEFWISWFGDTRARGENRAYLRAVLDSM